MNEHSNIDFSIFAESTPALIIYVDSDHRIRYLNKILEQWWNLSRDGSLNQRIADVLGSDLHTAFQPGIEAALAGKTLDFEIKVGCKDGLVRALETSYFPDKDADGHVRGFFLRAEDVTTRKANERANTHLASIVESSDDIIVSKSLDGIIQSWNKAAERIFGYTAEETIGKSIMIIIPRNRHDEEKMILSRIRSGERIEHYETIRVAKDGRHIAVSLTVSPLKDPSGKIVGVSKIARDITRQKKFEDELVKSNRELEQFAYVASHDLQEPLRKVALHSQIFRSKYESKLDDDGKRTIATISDSVRRMQTLVQDLLAFSRVNKETTRTETVNLNDVVREVMRDIEVTIKEKHAKISFDSLPTIDANRFQMHQLFQNLLSNAIKFTEGRQPIVLIGSKQVDGDVIIEVQDNGIGIESQYHKQIFNVFQRLHGKDKYPGSGIGLAICKKIMEQHGGRIWLSSKPGVGTTFFVSFPQLQPLETSPSEIKEEAHAQ